MQPTETTAQAAQRVQGLVEEAFAHLPAGAELEFNDGSDFGSCDDGAGLNANGKVFVEKRYRIVADPAGAWPRDQAIPALVAFWQQAGYQVYNDQRDARPPRYVVRTPDDYLVLIAAWDRKTYYDYTLTSSSPCIWENGSPDPK